MAGKKRVTIPRTNDFTSEADVDPKAKKARVQMLKNGLIFDAAKYEYKEDFVPADPSKPLEAHTTHEMIDVVSGSSPCLGRRDKPLRTGVGSFSIAGVSNRQQTITGHIIDREPCERRARSLT